MIICPVVQTLALTATMIITIITVKLLHFINATLLVARFNRVLAHDIKLSWEKPRLSYVSSCRSRPFLPACRKDKVAILPPAVREPNLVLPYHLTAPTV